MCLPDGRRWDFETDLLVVGAGAAGMTAALVGALEGLQDHPLRKIRHGRRHHRDVGGHGLDSGQPAKQRRRIAGYDRGRKDLSRRDPGRGCER